MSELNTPTNSVPNQESNIIKNDDENEVSEISEESVSLSSSAVSLNESEKSESKKPTVSKIARPTGLKLSAVGATGVSTSSRIARLCNNASKPNLPSNTNATGGEGTKMSSIGKISEELARRKIADIDEMDENVIPYLPSEKWAYERKMSSGSALSDSSRKSSPDQNKQSDASLPADSPNEYWESDFELRLSPDASVVLTQDTDQFIIGDRVWVGGAKPGQIAYIGETQFAPGEWAGIVLDEPIGKNDGTVANIRYFQCEPKKGIFSRLTRLTRYPLLDGGAGEPAATRPVSSTVKPEPKKTNGSLVTPAAKKNLVLTPTSVSKNSISNKPSSPDGAPLPNLVVGDRVIVKSSQGSKAGILRYIGTTDFAAGEWCGVELDDPLGKNDGSVSGTRYFECQPKFGLFAPLHKVSKSPANKRLFQPCMIHKGGASGLRRQGSKESLVSMSSTASTAASVKSTTRKLPARTATTPNSVRTSLQETLKEKQLHIEKLLKERDLERAEITRAANQADEAERQLACFKQEHDQYRRETETRIVELESLVTLLKSENEEFANLLEDEKKKNEDLQFRFEEETIDKADIESNASKYEERVSILEKTLAEERKRLEVLEHDSNKLFEAEEQMVTMKDELDTTKEELEKHKKVRYSLEQEHISLEAHLTSARAEIESLKIENQALKASATKDETAFKENVSNTLIKLEETKKELEAKQGQIQELYKLIESKDKVMADKEKEFQSTYKTLMQELTEKHKSEIDVLTKKSEEINSNGEAKLKILEGQLAEKMHLCNELEKKLNNVNIEMSKSAAEMTINREKQREVEEKLEQQLKQHAQELHDKGMNLSEETARCKKLQEEIGKLKEELIHTKSHLEKVNESKDKELSELNELLRKQMGDFNALKADHDNKLKECESFKELINVMRKEIEEKVQTFDKNMKKKETELLSEKQSIGEIKVEFEAKSKEIKELFETREKEYKMKIKSLENAEQERKSEVEKLCKDMESLKNSLDARENELKGEQNNSKNLVEKLLALEESYRKTSEEKDQMQLEAGDANRKLQSLEEKLSHLTSQKLKLESDITTFVNSSNDSSLQMNKLNDDLRQKEKELDMLREEISSKTQHFERVEQELKQTLERQDSAFKSSKIEFEKASRQYCEEIENLKNKIETSAVALHDNDNEWKKKLEDSANVFGAEIKALEDEVRNFKENDVELKNKCDDFKNTLSKIQNDHEIKMEEAKNETEKMKNSFVTKINELTKDRDDLIKSVEKLSQERFEIEKNFNEKLKTNADVQSKESQKLQDELKETSEKLNSTVLELRETKEEKNKINEEKSKLEAAASLLEELLKKAQTKNEELTANVTSADTENKILKETINQLREEKYQMDKESTDKMMLVSELNSQMKVLELEKKRGEEENDVKAKRLEEEIASLKEKLENSKTIHSAERAEKETIIKNLQKEIDSYKNESSQILSSKEKDMESMNSFVAHLKKEMESTKTESDSKSEKIEKLEKSVQMLSAELETERKKRQEFEAQFIEWDKERMDLKEKYEEQTNLLAKSSDTADKLSEMRRKLSEAEEREKVLVGKAKLEKENLETKFRSASNLLSQKESEVKTLTKEVDALKQANASLIDNNKCLKDSLEREKAESGKVQQVRMSSANAQNNVHTGSSGVDSMDEHTLEKGQIDFLNSVIVDMQKKNDALKARIEILEMGFSPEDIDVFDLHKINTRSVAPRLFCDICDQFDLHDTEDCPTQAMDDDLPPKSSKSKVPPPERPYCDVCEVFGHDTADCEDATF